MDSATGSITASPPVYLLGCQNPKRFREWRGSVREEVAERGQTQEGREQVAKTVNFFLEQAGVTFGKPNYVQIT